MGVFLLDVVLETGSDKLRSKLVLCHPTSGSLSRQLPHNSFIGTYSSWHAKDLKDQSQTAYVGIQNFRIKPKHLQPFCGSLKARAPPWWNPPIFESCVSPRLSTPSNNWHGVKLHSSCQRTPTAHCCLPGGTSSLFG